jgi:hypothetical protein
LNFSKCCIWLNNREHMLSNSTLSDHLWTQTIAGWCRFEGALTLVLLLSPSSLITSLWTCKLPVSPRPQSRVCVCFLRYVEPGGTCNIQVQVKPSRLEIPLEPLCHWKRAQFWQIGQVEWVSQPCINRVFMEDMPTDRKLLQFVIFFLVVTEAHDTPVDRKQTTH